MRRVPLLGLLNCVSYLDHIHFAINLTSFCIPHSLRTVKHCIYYNRDTYHVLTINIRSVEKARHAAVWVFLLIHNCACFAVM